MVKFVQKVLQETALKVILKKFNLKTEYFIYIIGMYF